MPAARALKAALAYNEIVEAVQNSSDATELAVTAANNAAVMVSSLQHLFTLNIGSKTFVLLTVSRCWQQGLTVKRKNSKAL